MVVWPSGVACAALLLVRGLGAQGVHEEDAPAGLERGSDEVPEGGEPFGRNVREPESEEDRIVLLVWAPVEEVCPEVADAASRPASLSLARLISSTSGEASTAVTRSA